jgi:hypothetical protein
MDDIRNIYVITPHNFETVCNDIIFINENIFPFTRSDVLDILKFKEKNDLVHWYLQQLLKIYSMVLLDTTDHVLILDADLIFTKPIKFIDEQGVCNFGFNKDILHKPYINHIHKLIPSL